MNECCKWIEGKPEFNGLYIVHSNIGVHIAWYNKNADIWEDSMKKSVEINPDFKLEIYKYQNLPKP